MPNVTQKERIVYLGEILNRLIGIKRITIKELAEKSGISRSQIYRILNEKSTSRLRLNTIHELANALDVPPKLLYNAPYEIKIEEE